MSGRISRGVLVLVVEGAVRSVGISCIVDCPRNGKRGAGVVGVGSVGNGEGAGDGWSGRGGEVGGNDGGGGIVGAIQRTISCLFYCVVTFNSEGLTAI